MTTTDAEHPVWNIASVMPLLTFPGSGIYDYAKEHGYFTDDEDYWNKYGHSFRIGYTDYTDEEVLQIVNMGNLMHRWKYHQSEADNLLKSLEMHGIDLDTIQTTLT